MSSLSVSSVLPENHQRASSNLKLLWLDAVASHLCPGFSGATISADDRAVLLESVAFADEQGRREEDAPEASI